MASISTSAYPAVMDAESNVRILCLGWADGRTGGVAGCYLADYDPDGNDGWGAAAWTADPGAALTFDSRMAALTLWRTPSTVRPVRPDGEPNLPLTSFSIELTR